MQADAMLSADGLYRYWLIRRWGEGDDWATFIMLNPSTADASRDDPTLRRCIGFAQREGCDALRVVNLYAYRTPSPRQLRLAPDPVGPDNDLYLERAFEESSLLIAAWGNAGRRDRIARVMDLARGQLNSLGTTRSGQPHHPVRVRQDQPLMPWPPQDPARSAPRLAITRILWSVGDSNP